MLNPDDRLSTYKDWYKREMADGRETFEKFHFLLEEQLGDVSLSGKCVLEVGCGKGFISLFLAMCTDVKQVVALDEAEGEGSPIGVTQPLKEAIGLFGLKNIVVEEIDVMLNNYPDAYFDIIIANNALHHVVTPGLLSTNHDAQQGYLSLFRELKRLLVPDGMLLIWEYSRQSLWRWLPIKLKWKHIDWELHPTLDEWLKVIKDAGFRIRRCEYKVPYVFRKLKVFFSNAVVQFFIYPSFFITAQK